jgi:acyl-CoA thioester hydrolase
MRAFHSLTYRDAEMTHEVTDTEALAAPHDRFGSLRLPRYRAAVIPEWTDRNEHLNNAYYLIAVQGCYLAALKAWRGEEHQDRSSTGNFTMQSLVTHLRELRLGAKLLVIPRLIGLDEKRAHVLIELHNEDEGYLGAVIEKTSINVARGQPPVVVNFSDVIRQRLQDVLAAHSNAPLPAGIQPALALNPRQAQRSGDRDKR